MKTKSMQNEQKLGKSMLEKKIKKVIKSGFICKKHDCDGCDFFTNEIMNIFNSELPKIEEETQEIKKGETKRLWYQKGFQEAEKAYGGCHNCYGKGYSTYRHGLSGAADFEGETGFETAPKTHMLYCSCDRGKQLESLTT